MEIRMKAARVYANILERCYNANRDNYKDWGGRGITVSEEWVVDPTKFFNWYIANHEDGLQVDRIDNDGPYSVENCRMSTAEENVRNRRNTIKLTAWGETKAIAYWLEDPRTHPNLENSTIKRRIGLGWNAEEILTHDPNEYIRINEFNKNGQTHGHHPGDPMYVAFGETKTLAAWSKDDRCKVGKKVLWDRLQRNWEIERAISSPPGNKIKIYSGHSVNYWYNSKECEISYGALKRRLEAEIPLEQALKKNIKVDIMKEKGVENVIWTI